MFSLLRGEVFHTNGNGLWSNRAAKVQITGSEICYVSADKQFGELRVYFTGWDPSEDGLIYTDRLFLSELRAALDRAGLPGRDVDYSEQGMQGDDYVSLDVGKDFLSLVRGR
jgi:hypothetical protein